MHKQKGPTMNKRLVIIAATVLLVALTGCSNNRETLSQILSVANGTKGTAVEPVANAVSSVAKLILSDYPTIEETVLIDEGDVKIAATELNYDEGRPRLDLLLENYSDIDLNFECGLMGYEGVAVNGYMVDYGSLYASVMAGNTAKEDVSFYLKEFELYGITDIASIQIGFEIDTEDYDNYLMPEPVILKTSLDRKYDYSTDYYLKNMKQGIGGTVGDYTIQQVKEDKIYDQGGVQIVSEVLAKNTETGEQSVFLEFYNGSDAIVNTRISDITANGIKLTGRNWAGRTIFPGCRCIIELDFSQITEYYYMTPYDIGDIGPVNMLIHQSDTDYKTIVDDENATIAFSENGTFDVTGDEIYNSNDIRIVSKGIYTDNDTHYNVDAYWTLMIENNSEVEVKAYPGILSLNDYMVKEDAAYRTYSTCVAPHSTGSITIGLSNESLEAIGINEVSDIVSAELKLELKTGDGDAIDTPRLQTNF